MELIQYEPQTETVFETPLLASPPWINKYYIMDLAPRRSFIEWAVRHGHTTFAISYRNPDASMRDTSLDDYLLDGPLAALDVIADITGADQANIVGPLPRRHPRRHDCWPGWPMTATSGSARPPCSTP